MNNIGQSITTVNALARKIQAIAADGKRNAEVYELATQLILEAHMIRQLTQEKATIERTIADIVKNSGVSYAKT
jgi:hypothetical protein